MGDVDQSTGQVAGVGGAKRRVTEALAGAVSRDEVLEDREAFSEGGLDRTRDHLTARVGHQALHGGDLTDLLAVTTSSGVDHHADRVVERRVHGTVGGVTDLLVGVGPDLDLLLATLVVDDDPSAVVGLDLGGLLLVLVQDRGLLRRRDDVVDGDGESRERGVTEAQRLDGVE